MDIVQIARSQDKVLFFCGKTICILGPTALEPRIYVRKREKGGLNFPINCPAILFPIAQQSFYKQIILVVRKEHRKFYKFFFFFQYYILHNKGYNIN